MAHRAGILTGVRGASVLTRTVVAVLPLLLWPLAATAAAPDLAAAGTLWAACSKGDAGACYRLECLATVRIPDAAARAAATAPLEEGCAKKDPAACFALAMYLDDDGGMPIDGQRAFELVKAACAAGFAPACVREAVFYMVSVPSREPGAPARVTTLLRAACEAGLPQACHDFARFGGLGGGVAPDADIAAEALAKACAGGSFAACRRQAAAALPERPFACDQCAPDAASGRDDRCVSCEIAACRAAHCCPTCPDRTTFACCAEELGTRSPYPLTTPPADATREAMAREVARMLLVPSVVRLEELCEGGFAPACRDLAGLYGDETLPFRDAQKAAACAARAKARPEE